jgi:MFS family permease
MSSKEQTHMTIETSVSPSLNVRKKDDEVNNKNNHDDDKNTTIITITSTTNSTKPTTTTTTTIIEAAIAATPTTTTTTTTVPMEEEVTKHLITSTKTTLTPSSPFTWSQRLRFHIFSPSRLLVFLFIVNVLIYFDRGAISAVTPTLENHWDLTKTQQGALASAFMVGYMIFCPIFAELATRISVNIILTIGLVGWALATFACGMSGGNSKHIWGYYMLVVCRCLVGIGEAAFAPIAPTLIDDSAPEKQKTTFMSIFYIALPCGVALGYGVSGFLAARVSWRLPFMIEAVLMLICAIACLFIPPSERYKEYREYKERLERGELVYAEEDVTLILEKNLKQSTEENPEVLGLVKDNESNYNTDEVSEFSFAKEEPPIQHTNEKKYNIFQAIYALALNPTYVFATLGATVYTFVVGGLAFWAPSVVATLLDWDPEYANLAFSAVCVVTGLFGSFFGGIVLDFIGGAEGMRGASRAFMLCTIYTLVALPLGTIAFSLRSAIPFFILLSVAELFVFGITSPMNVAFLNIVPKNLRNFSMSFQIFMIHIAGDMPSPVIFGRLADAFGKAKGVLVAVHFLWAMFIFSIIFFFFTWIIARSKARRVERMKAYLKSKREALTKNQSLE